MATQKSKARRLKRTLKGLAIIDILFANKFELYIYTSEGVRTSKTTYWKQEIDEAAEKNRLQ